MTEPSASTDISPRPIDLTRRAVSPDAGLSPRATRVTPVDVGVFGGSGLYELFDDVEHVEVATPYGPPSAPIAVSEIPSDGGAVRVGFLPRHGRRHHLPPHLINYRANVWALHHLGARRILSPCASGSLQPEIHPGDLVVCDQLVDRTSGRPSTFFDGPTVNHVSFGDPYCSHLRSTVAERAVAAGATVHSTGTVVVIDGPRFSTRAESAWYRAQGWQVINMTQAPEAALCRELGICHSALAVVTDYDAGVDRPGTAPVTQDEVYAAFAAVTPQIRGIIVGVLASLVRERTCDCDTATNGLTPDPPHDLVGPG